MVGSAKVLSVPSDPLLITMLTAEQCEQRNSSLLFHASRVTFCPLIALQRDHTSVTLVNSLWSIAYNHVNRRAIRTKEFISTFRRLSWPLIVLQLDYFGVTAVLCSSFLIDNHDSHRQWTKEFNYIVIPALLSAFTCWMFCVLTRTVQFLYW